MFCLKCGAELPNDATFCSKCGAAQNNAKSVASTPDEQVAQKESYNALCIIGLIFSILSLSLTNLGLIFAAVGLIASAIGLSSCNKKGEKGKPLAIGGITISLITLLIFVLSRTSLW